jgi:hypothetical protein
MHERQNDDEFMHVRQGETQAVQIPFNAKVPEMQLAKH